MIRSWEKKKKHLLWFQNRSSNGSAPLLPFCLISERDICCDHCLSSECTVTVKNIINTKGFFPIVKFRELLHQPNNAGIYALNLSNMLTETFRLASTRALYLKENWICILLAGQERVECMSLSKVPTNFLNLNFNKNNFQNNGSPRCLVSRMNWAESKSLDD